MDIAADDEGMVRRNVPMRLEEPGPFGNAVGKQWLHLAPIPAARADLRRAIDDVGFARERPMGGRRIKLVIHQHRSEALIGRNAVERDALRRREAGGAAMAEGL